MRVALIADTFPPLRTSGAVQLRDLSREFFRQGHELTVILPSTGQQEPWLLQEIDGVQLLRLKAPRTKDVGYIRRTLGEAAMPFAMLWNLRKSPLANEKWDGVIWYSPSIFHGPLVSALKRSSGCICYLIIRDIFPEWAVDMGLMSRGLSYRFFDAIARFQYSVADVIGIQAKGNRRYFEEWLKQPDRKLEVLQNWLGRPKQTRCSIRIDETPLAGRKVFVYAGNMGVAQGMDILLELAVKCRSHSDVGFLFVGRGSAVAKLKEMAEASKLNNVIFFDEIDPDEIPDLYAQCSVGIVSLDPRHKSHNIPGKFLTYMQCSLPVLANVNAGNDIASLIRNEQVGQVCETNNIEDLVMLVELLLAQIETDTALASRCQKLFQRDFSVDKATRQIVTALNQC